MMTPALQTATALRALGISAIPVRGDKRPLIPWKPYQTRLPTEDELAKWFARPVGVAICAGGQAGVECLDFDEKYARGILSRFTARAKDAGLEHLLGELATQRTPSGGFHLVWRCQGRRIGNEKLATRPATEEERAAGNRELTMIETRGEGGYFLVAPSEGYELQRGPPYQVFE